MVYSWENLLIWLYAIGFIFGKHKILEHTEDENIKFKMEITGLYKDALTRQANEAIRIKNCEKSEILNSKSQFNHPPISRIVDEKSKKTKANSLKPKNWS